MIASGVATYWRLKDGGPQWPAQVHFIFGKQVQGSVALRV
jgi:hypothetical protein